MVQDVRASYQSSLSSSLAAAVTKTRISTSIQWQRSANLLILAATVNYIYQLAKNYKNFDCVNYATILCGRPGTRSKVLIILVLVIVIEVISTVGRFYWGIRS